MTDAPSPLIACATAAAMPPEPGRLSALLRQHGTMQLRWYEPKGSDPQTPHDQDEVYVVVTGTGWFTAGGQRVRFGRGDALFVPAGTVHRFEEFSPDFATWVIFYGPPGGEGGGESP